MTIQRRRHQRTTAASGRRSHESPLFRLFLFMVGFAVTAFGLALLDLLVMGVRI